MSVYTEFFLNSRASNVELELFEISHPSFNETFYLVRNNPRGVTVNHENGASVDYEYVPIRARLTGPRDDLEQILQIELGDLGEIIPQQVDLIRSANTMATRPLVIYRSYRSNDLTTPLVGPFRLEIKNLSLTKQGASFEAKAPSLNVSKTGERYTMPRFPMFKGLV